MSSFVLNLQVFVTNSDFIQNLLYNYKAHTLDKLAINAILPLLIHAQ